MAKNNVGEDIDVRHWRLGIQLHHRPLQGAPHRDSRLNVIYLPKCQDINRRLIESNTCIEDPTTGNVQVDPIRFVPPLDDADLSAAGEIGRISRKPDASLQLRVDSFHLHGHPLAKADAHIKVDCKFIGLFAGRRIDDDDILARLDRSLGGFSLDLEFRDQHVSPERELFRGADEFQPW